MARPRSDGWWYPWIFVGGMALVVVVNLILVFFAVDSFTGIATEDHYRKGLAYDSAIAAERRQAERGWSMALAVEPAAAADAAAAHAADVSVTFADRHGRPLEDLAVRAEFVRPTHEGYDTTATLTHRGGGRYGAAVALPLPGQWNARVHARRGAEEFRENRRIFLPR